MLKTLVKALAITTLIALACVQGNQSTITSNFHPGIPDPLSSPPPVWFQTTVSSSQGVSDATGRPAGSHLIYAANSGTWWLFWINNATNTIQTSYSFNLINWAAGASIVLTNNIIDGINFGVGYKNIAGQDIVHIAASFLVTNTNRFYAHVRAVVTGTTIAFGAQLTPEAAATLNFVSPFDGPAVAFGSDNRVYDFASFWNDSGGAFGNFDVVPSSNIDLGTSWVSGWPASAEITTVSNVIASHFGSPLAGGNMLSIQDDGGDCVPSCQADMTNLLWSKGTNAAWPAAANIFGANFASATTSPNDWDAVRVDDTHTYVVLRSGANTFSWQMYNGVAWSIPGAGIPNQTSQGGSGPFLTTDGVNLWLFVIDSDAPNTIRVNQYNGATWGVWQPVTTTSAIRSFLSGYKLVTNSLATILWTEFNGGNYFNTVGSYPVP